jgi:hypothetical protein
MGRQTHWADREPMLDLLIAVAIIFAIGFASGYFVRAKKSRRRRAEAMEKFLKKHPEERF